MNTMEKIKKTILIALGFALATYLIMSGFAILNKDTQDHSEHNESVVTHS